MVVESDLVGKIVMGRHMTTIKKARVRAVVYAEHGGFKLLVEVIDATGNCDPGELMTVDAYCFAVKRNGDT